MNLRKSLLPTLALFAMVPGVALAQTLVVTPEGLPSLVRQGNPSLAAARLAIDEAAGRLLGAGRLSNPELELGGQHNHKFKEGGIELGLSQQFPLTDRLEREREVSTAEVEAARAEVRDAERLLIAKAREALVKLLIVREQRGNMTKQMKVSNDLAEFIGKAAERGEGSILDAGQTRLEAVRHTADMRQFTALEAAEIGALKRLIGVSADREITVGGSLPKAVVPDSGVAASDRPDWVAAGIQVKRAESAVDLEQARRLEDLKVGVVAGWERTEDAPEGFENEGIVGVRVSMPLPFWDKNEGGIAEAKASLARRESEVMALEQSIQHEAATARAEMVQWLSVANSIDDDLLPLAETQADKAEQAFRNGQGDLQAVLRVREQQLELSATRLEALREYHLARVRYETAIGK